MRFETSASKYSNICHDTFVYFIARKVVIGNSFPSVLHNVSVVCSGTTSVTADIITINLDHQTTVTGMIGVVRPVLATEHRFVVVLMLSASTQVYFTRTSITN